MDSDARGFWRISFWCNNTGFSEEQDKLDYSGDSGYFDESAKPPGTATQVAQPEEARKQTIIDFS